MAAPKGNRFWEARSQSGRNPIFANPDELWNAAVEYFEWVEDNPLWENKVAQFQGVQVDMPSKKMRAMTQGALCLFLDIGTQTLDDYGAREDFSGIVAKIKSVIYQQKFAGAAADLLNVNIICRELGLKDASKSEISGPGGGPLEVSVSTLTQDQALELLKKNDMAT